MQLTLCNFQIHTYKAYYWQTLDQCYWGSYFETAVSLSKSTKSL